MTQLQPKKALILAGGGLKVAFQAGVLQIWLDEAGMTFDYVNGASGGTLNLAMYCQGMSGTQIANNWRAFQPLHGLALNAPFSTSFLKYDRFRKNVFKQWGLNFARIRASTQVAYFDLYNFGRHELYSLGPQHMSEDHLIACISLPMWFPPVEIDGELYIDAVYHTDANIEGAIRAGADEIWVVWTVSERGEWHNNLINQYFQIIEISANGRFKEIVQRIHENNARIDAGETGEFGRRINLRILRKEVPVHYLINFSAERVKAVVELGVAEARTWWTTQPDLPPLPTREIPPRTGVAVWCGQTLQGQIAFGKTDPATSFRKGRHTGGMFQARLKIIIDDIEQFLADPDHRASLTGSISCLKLGSNLAIETGTLCFFPNGDSHTLKELRYQFTFRDGAGRLLTLVGMKRLRRSPGADVWYDTTSLGFTIVEGFSPDVVAAPEQLVATGMLRMRFRDVLLSLLQLRSRTAWGQASCAAVPRFIRFFIRQLWDSYFHHVQSPGPF